MKQVNIICNNNSIVFFILCIVVVFFLIVGTRDFWCDKTTKYVLDKYFEYSPLVGPLKKYSKELQMWKAIAD